MRILHIPNAYDPVLGGAELHCRRVSEALAARGHSVQVLTTDVGSGEAYYYFGVKPVRNGKKVLNGVNIKRIRFSDRLMYEPIGRWAASMRPRRAASYLSACVMSLIRSGFVGSIEKEIRLYRPDVVMTMPHLVFNVECVLLARREKSFPLVYLPLLHTSDPNWPANLIREALTQVDSVIPSTDYEARQLKQSYGVPESKIFVGMLGVDIPEKKSLQPRRNSVLFLGRKVLAKGVLELIQAMRYVWQAQPGIELILAGSRDSGSADIERAVAELVPAQRANVKILDNVSEDEKRQLLESCRCLVLPSRFESFGIVLLEAWAHSTPIVAWRLPVFESVVNDGQDGFLAPIGDVGALSESILRLVTDGSLASRMGNAGYEKVKEGFTWDKVAERYERAYQHAIDSWKKNNPHNR